MEKGGCAGSGLARDKLYQLYHMPWGLVFLSFLLQQPKLMWSDWFCGLQCLVFTLSDFC